MRIVADGGLSMGRWSVKASQEIDIIYHAFSMPLVKGLPECKSFGCQVSPVLILSVSGEINVDSVLDTR